MATATKEVKPSKKAGSLKVRPLGDKVLISATKPRPRPSPASSSPSPPRTARRPASWRPSATRPQHRDRRAHPAQCEGRRQGHLLLLRRHRSEARHGRAADHERVGDSGDHRLRTTVRPSRSCASPLSIIRRPIGESRSLRCHTPFMQRQEEHHTLHARNRSGRRL